MKRIWFILIPMVLMGSMCTNERIVYKSRYVTPTIGEDLRTPCPQKAREVRTLSDVQLVLTDTQERADCNGTKIVSIDEILTAHDARIAELTEGTDAN